MSHVLLVNPRKRKRRKARAKAKSSRRRLRRNPIFRAHRKRRRSARRSTFGRVRRFRRNPSSISQITGTLMPAMIGAGGALAVDVAMNVIPLPDVLKGSAVKPLVKVAAAFGIGLVAGMVAGKDVGRKVTAGAVTVVAYDTVKGFLQTNVPSLPLSEVDSFPSYEFEDPSLLPGNSGMGIAFDANSEFGEVFSEEGIY